VLLRFDAVSSGEDAGTDDRPGGGDAAYPHVNGREVCVVKRMAEGEEWRRYVE
jgi:hypothetical protein